MPLKILKSQLPTKFDMCNHSRADLSEFSAAMADICIYIYTHLGLFSMSTFSQVGLLWSFFYVCLYTCRSFVLRCVADW